MTIDLPIVPNFIFCPINEQIIPIASLSDSQLTLIADMWRDELLNRARIARNKRKNPHSIVSIQVQVNI